MDLYAYNGPDWFIVPRPMSQEELTTLGAVLVVDDPVPEGVYWVTGVSLYDLGGVPHRAFVGDPWSIERARQYRHVDRETTFQRLINDGYPCVLGGNAETLQMRDNDKTNWLTLKDACRDARDAGAFEMQSQLPLRTTSNANYALTYHEVWDLLIAARAWYAGMMGRNWLLTATIDAAVTQEELDTIPVETGWPGQ
jgi:hypothetical protein